MGQFSWFCNDDNHRIVNCVEETIYMVDDKGNVYTEDCYGGYGVFGGKDYYELLAEMNGKGSDRHAGIEIAFNDEEGNYYPQGDNPHIIYPSLCHKEPKYFDGKPSEIDPDQGFGYGGDWDEYNEDDWR